MNRIIMNAARNNQVKHIQIIAGCLHRALQDVFTEHYRVSSPSTTGRPCYSVQTFYTSFHSSPRRFTMVRFWNTMTGRLLDMEGILLHVFAFLSLHAFMPFTVYQKNKNKKQII
jgi:hypothetical protein